MTITEPLGQHAVRYPDRPAIVSDQETITYSTLYRRMNRMASVFLANRRSLKIEKQEHRIAILLGNRPEFLEVFLGIASMGSIAVVLDVKWTVEDVFHEIRTCRASLIVTETDFYKKCHLKELGMPLWIVDDENDKDKLYPPPTDPLLPRAKEEDLFYMGFTSGTTGRPKGFTRTQRSWVATFQASDEAFALTDCDHVLSPGAFVHSLSLYAALYSLYIGATFYVQPAFDVSQLIGLIQQQPISVIFMVPTMIKSLFHRIPDESHLENLRKVISSGDKLDKKVKHKFFKKFPGVDLYEYYGASELSFVSVLGPEENREKPDSVGRPFRNVQIEIRDDTGQVVPSGKTGTLYVKSPMLFSHYFENPAETKKVLQDGWATVGDQAQQDQDGFLYLAGRKQNMIIGGGYNIYPEEIEKAFKHLPDVEEAVVIGIKDEFWGEKPVAGVTIKDGATINVRQLKKFCKTQLPRYKCPREIYIFHAFPLTTGSKIARKQVRKMIEDHYIDHKKRK